MKFNHYEKEALDKLDLIDKAHEFNKAERMFMRKFRELHEHFCEFKANCEMRNYSHAGADFPTGGEFMGMKVFITMKYEKPK